jgi:serine O-acetyltransferase
MSPNDSTDAMRTWDLVREDFERHGRSRTHPGMHALVLHRVGQASRHGTGPKHRVGRLLYRLGRILVLGAYNIEIPVDATIGRRLHLPHPHGLVLNDHVVIGDDCMLRHNVTLGAASDTRDREAPTLGDGVQVGPGAVVYGRLTVGDGALIGPNAVVVDDVPAGARVLAPVASVRPARPGTVPAGL